MKSPEKQTLKPSLYLVSVFENAHLLKKASLVCSSAYANLINSACMLRYVAKLSPMKDTGNMENIFHLH